MSNWRSAHTTSSGRPAVGYVVGVKGLRGGIRVEPLSDRDDRLVSGAPVFVDSEDEPRLIGTVEPAHGATRSIVLHLDGVADRAAAERLVGRYLEVDAAPLPDDTYYWHELIGITARDESGQIVGQVAEVFRAGENEVYRIVGPGGETLVPALREVVRSLDVAGRAMVIRLDVEEIR
ncbi:MAG: ribosome maturation factor RimM [Chloroflexota bacterium]|nr:ribosome maturation factor RimM [Chloroflexota bacterium]